MFDPAINAIWNPEYIRIGEMLSSGYIIEARGLRNDGGFYVET